MPVKKSGKSKGLGKGLDALIPSINEDIKKEDSADISGNGEIKVSISKVEPNRNQPRKTFDEEKLNELAESIKRHSLLQPILVQDKGDYYEIVAGERRWRAAMIAGLKEVPIKICELTERERAEISLAENIQREDLNPIEEALAYKSLMDDYGMKQEELAEIVSKNRATVANVLRLLNLPSQVQQMLVEKTISSGHARALLAINDSEKQVEIANKIIDKKLSVRDVEKMIKNLDKPESPKKATDEQLKILYTDIESNLRAKMSAKVNVIAKDREKGKIEIEYYSQEEFQIIVDKLYKGCE